MLLPRRATAADLDTVRRITLAAYAEYDAVLDQAPLPVSEDYGPLIAAGAVWLVARDGSDIAVAVLEPGPDHLLIFSLAVLPEARGGIGRFLLEFAEEHARAAGLPEVRLYTNERMTRNIGIYRQAGYRETGRMPNPKRPGWISVHMAKRIELARSCGASTGDGH